MNAPSLKEVLDRAEALYRDLRLGAVKEWKARTGGLAVGFMPVYAPRELLHSQGVLPVGIMGAGDDLEIIRGDAYYQSYICHIPRSTIEMALSGHLDPLDGMLFPAICDVIRNLSGIWKMHFPAKFVRYLDVPQNFDPEMGGRFWRKELEGIAAELAERGARPYDPEALRRSIALYNDHRAAVQGLYALRAQKPWIVPTGELYAILRAGLVLPPEEHLEMMRAYRAGAEADPARRPMTRPGSWSRAPSASSPPSA
jgi:benzoyl-CoA reductase subunit C